MPMIRPLGLAGERRFNCPLYGSREGVGVLMLPSTAFSLEGISQRNKSVAASAPSNCTAMKPGVSMGRMPVKVSLIERARVTAGFAKEVEAVNQ